MEQNAGQDDTVQQKNSIGSETWEWAKAILIAGVLVLIIRYFVFAPFIVDGPSMQPNFETGERLIVNKLIYEIRKPRHGEVIVFHAPEGKDYIKRVIALPGETVKIADNKVYVNGKALDEPYIREAVEAYANQNRENKKYNADFPEIKVPEGMFFAMGDNRPNSKDSRNSLVGPQPFEKIIGRADIIFWPVGKMSFVKH